MQGFQLYIEMFQSGLKRLKTVQTSCKNHVVISGIKKDLPIKGGFFFVQTAPIITNAVRNSLYSWYTSYELQAGRRILHLRYSFECGGSHFRPLQF